MAEPERKASIAAKLILIQQAYLEMGEPVTEERLEKLATAADTAEDEWPESLLQLIEAVGTIHPADPSSSAGRPDQAPISDKTAS